MTGILKIFKIFQIRSHPERSFPDGDRFVFLPIPRGVSLILPPPCSGVSGLIRAPEHLLPPKGILRITLCLYLLLFSFVGQGALRAP